MLLSTKNMILGLLILGIGFSTIPTFAETLILPPPHKHEITTPHMPCTESRILMQQPSGNLSCIYEDTAKTLKHHGWHVVSADTITKDNTRFTYSTINPSPSLPASRVSFPVEPIVTMDIPATVSVGETFAINYAYFWIESNVDPTQLETPMNHSEWLDQHQESERYFWLLLPDEFSVVTPNVDSINLLADPYVDHVLKLHSIWIPYEPAKTHSGSIELRLDKKMMYDEDYLEFGSGRTIEYLIVKEDNGVRFDSDIQNKSPFDYDSVYHRYSTLVSEPYKDYTPEPIPEPHASETSLGPYYLPRDENGSWDEFAEFLRTVQIYENPQDMTMWLLDQDFALDFVNDFLAEYPEFRIQDVEKPVSGQLYTSSHILIYDSFDTGLDGWEYKEVPWISGIEQWCDTQNTDVYSFRYSNNHQGSAHIPYTVQCWFGFAGGAKSFEIPSQYDGGSMIISLDYRSLTHTKQQTPIDHPNNIFYIIYDSDGNNLHTSTLFDGLGYLTDPIDRLLDASLHTSAIFDGLGFSTIPDSGWNSFTANIPPLDASECPCTLYIFTKDRWMAEWNQQFYFDNVRLEIIPPDTKRTIFFDTFSNGSLDSWEYTEMPVYEWNQKHCGTQNTNAYLFSQTSKHHGSAHVMYKPATMMYDDYNSTMSEDYRSTIPDYSSYQPTCWFGFAGGAKSFEIPSKYDGGDLHISLNYKSMADVPYEHNNIFYTLYDSDDNLIIKPDMIFQGLRNSTATDSGWSSFAKAIPPVDSSVCPCTLYIFTNDSWLQEYGKQIYFDNVHVAIVMPSVLDPVDPVPAEPVAPGVITVEKVINRYLHSQNR